MTATEWANSYFLRLEEKLKVLNTHPTVDKVVSVQYKGLNDSEIDEIEEEITSMLNDVVKTVIDDYEFEDNHEAIDEIKYDFDKKFKFNNYIRAFYKISNGLNIIWHSNLHSSNLANIDRKNENIDSFFSATSEEDERADFEGFCALIPLHAFIDPYKYSIISDFDYTGYNEDLNKEEGLKMCFLDYFNYYYDTAIVLSKKDDNPTIILGEDHSASYNDLTHCDFVIYMEFLLATFFSVEHRSSELKFPNERTETLHEFLKEFEKSETKDYTKIIDFFAGENITPEDIIKND
ncbi:MULTISPECIES: hypothetical protein [Chryseobacterium]|uniref:hypothetical protein n=1 Tax=Chryseobacterium TaxID=59732 RepID=UPI000C9DB4E8|nr:MULTISPECIES: hypothetical protein [Chryseobacterium]VXC10567.1 conserved hypothetical protein [Chryseobacterium sp. 8AT]